MALAEPFYQDAKRGWFWYEDPPVHQEPVPESTTPRDVSLAHYTTAQLWDLHPDDFQQLLDGLHKKAVQSPTEQHILEYLAIQDIARRKALAYTNATQYVTRKYADLFTLNPVYPTSAPGTAARVQMQQNEITATIAGARQDHALVFFTAPGCGFCDQQARILAAFIDQYGWQVGPVDIERQPELALRFNITLTPTLLLLRQGGQSLPIASGVVTLPEIERNLYQAIRYLRGDTAIDSFTTYGFQQGGVLDPASILQRHQFWRPGDQ